MVEPLDFTLGTVVGIVIGVIAGFVANYLTEAFREQKRHERVVRAFIRELSMIRDNIKDGQFYKSVAVGTPVFSKLVAEIHLLRESTAEWLLITYSDLKFLLRLPMMTSRLNELKEEIDLCIKMLEMKLNTNKSGASHSIGCTTITPTTLNILKQLNFPKLGSDSDSGIPTE